MEETTKVKPRKGEKFYVWYKDAVRACRIQEIIVTWTSKTNRNPVVLCKVTGIDEEVELMVWSNVFYKSSADVMRKENGYSIAIPEGQEIIDVFVRQGYTMRDKTIVTYVWECGGVTEKEHDYYQYVHRVLEDTVEVKSLDGYKTKDECLANSQVEAVEFPDDEMQEQQYEEDCKDMFRYFVDRRCPGCAEHIAWDSFDRREDDETNLNRQVDLWCVGMESWWRDFLFEKVKDVDPVQMMTTAYNYVPTKEFEDFVSGMIDTGVINL